MRAAFLSTPSFRYSLSFAVITVITCAVIVLVYLHYPQVLTKRDLQNLTIAKPLENAAAIEEHVSSRKLSGGIEKIDADKDLSEILNIGSLQPRTRNHVLTLNEFAKSQELLASLQRNNTFSSIRFRPNLTHLSSLSVRSAYFELVKEYLAPWKGFSDGTEFKQLAKVPITKKMLAVMEYAYKGGSFRVRIADGNLYYRKIVNWKQTYRTQRMAWYLRLLYEMLKRDHLIQKNADFVIYVGDGPKVAADTFTTEAGFPLFSLRTSSLHVDIPIPDPVSHGSNGRYLWSDSGKAIPWNERMDRLVFRGRGSCLKMQADNWHFCNRVRAQKMSQEWPDLMDIGVIEWNQIYKANRMVVPPTTETDIERTCGLHLVKSLDFTAQSHYKYILDLDGGLGSSRKPGILSSGSVLFAQDSPWYTYYEPLLEPYRHYIPVDRWLRDLRDQILWARQNDQKVKSMVEEGRAFEKKFLSIEASKLYLSILLDQYSDLLAEQVIGPEPVEVDFCARMDNQEILEGPMGCSRDWLLYHGGQLPDEILSDGRTTKT